MKKFLWIAGFTGLMLGLLGVQTASKQEILNKYRQYISKKTISSYE